MRTALFIFIMSLSISLLAQLEPESKGTRELGINLLAIDDFNFSTEGRMVLPGVYYHQSYDRKLLRISAELHQRSFTSGPYNGNIVSSGNGGALHVSNSDSVHWMKNTCDLKLGYGFILVDRELLKIYGFSDLGLRVVETDGWYKRRFYSADTTLHPRTVKSRYVGISLGTGIKWKFWKAFTLCYETDCYAGVGWSKVQQSNAMIAPETILDFRSIRTLGLSWKF